MLFSKLAAMSDPFTAAKIQKEGGNWKPEELTFADWQGLWLAMSDRTEEEITPETAYLVSLAKETLDGLCATAETAVQLTSALAALAPVEHRHEDRKRILGRLQEMADTASAEDPLKGLEIWLDIWRALVLDERLSPDVLGRMAGIMNRLELYQMIKAGGICILQFERIVLLMLVDDDSLRERALRHFSIHVRSRFFFELGRAASVLPSDSPYRQRALDTLVAHGDFRLWSRLVHGVHQDVLAQPDLRQTCRTELLRLAWFGDLIRLLEEHLELPRHILGSIRAATDEDLTKEQQVRLGLTVDDLVSHLRERCDDDREKRFVLVRALVHADRPWRAVFLQGVEKAESYSELLVWYEMARDYLEDRNCWSSLLEAMLDSVWDDPRLLRNLWDLLTRLEVPRQTVGREFERVRRIAYDRMEDIFFDRSVADRFELALQLFEMASVLVDTRDDGSVIYYDAEMRQLKLDWLLHWVDEDEPEWAQRLFKHPDEELHSLVLDCLVNLDAKVPEDQLMSF